MDATKHSRFKLIMFFCRIGAYSIVSLMVFAFVVRPFDFNGKIIWLGPKTVYADDNDSDGGSDNGGEGDDGDSGEGDDGTGDKGDHDGRNGDHGDPGEAVGNDPDDAGDGYRDDGSAQEHSPGDTRDESEPVRSEGAASTGPDGDSGWLMGFDGMRDLTPVTEEEETDLVGNWGSASEKDQTGPSETKP